MKIGANYTPSQGWFHSWLDLDLDATRRDFEGIAQLGLDHAVSYTHLTLPTICSV